jgi:glycerophosphoryl diester phosphodiesterase
MIEVLAPPGRPWRIGHRGAAALAPGNTLAALERAVAEGVHAVEFDVLDLADGSLVLAHSDDLHDITHGGAHGPVRRLTLAELRRVFPALLTLEDALEFFAGAPATGLHVDLKLPGYEAAVVEALRRGGLVERTLVSSAFRSSLSAVRELEPGLRLGLAYPLDRHGLSHRRALTPALLSGLVAMRQALPYRLGSWIELTGATVLALQWFVVSRAAVRRAHAHGVAVWAWTVDGRRLATRMTAAGVDGLISNDPRVVHGTLMP